MAVFFKPKAGDQINGLVTVMTGAGPRNYDPGMNGSGDYCQRWASGDSLLFFRDLDGRYLNGPWKDDAVLAAAAGDTTTAASGASAAVYLTARENRQHVLFGAECSYLNTPTSGELYVQSPSGTTVFSAYITAAGPVPFDWPEGLRGAESSDMLIVLAHGGSNGSKKLSLRGRKEE